jgi:hypothetical protein
MEAALALSDFACFPSKMCSQRASLMSHLRNQRFLLSGTLQVSFSPARGRGSKLAITDYRGSNLELTIPCETYAIALLGKKSHSSSC